MLKSFKKTLAVNLSIILIIVVIAAAVLIWLIFDISKRTTAIQGAKSDIAVRLRTIDSLTSSKQSEPAAIEAEAILKNRLPTQDDLFVELSDKFDSLAAKNKLGFSFSFGKQTDGTDSSPGHIEFAMVIDGSLNNLLNFIKEIEQSEYFISLYSFNIIRRGDNFQSTINGKIFSQ